MRRCDGRRHRGVALDLLHVHAEWRHVRACAVGHRRWRGRERVVRCQLLVNGVRMRRLVLRLVVVRARVVLLAPRRLVVVVVPLPLSLMPMPMPLPR